MKVFRYVDVEAESAEDGASGVTVRWLIDERVGAENFAMRLFEIEPGGYTPHHSHPWEHEVFILDGKGVVIGEDGERPIEGGYVVFIPPNERHQFKNNSGGKLRFLCLIPYKGSRSEG